MLEICSFLATPLSPLLLLVLSADVSYPHLLYIDLICSVHASEISCLQTKLIEHKYIYHLFVKFMIRLE
ncbi:hypothetical protein BDE02_18G046900 [Populus trichocarpa]|nr:hypothetical protein BDE02_18G046900 [Populus trichocarpa]